MAESLLSRKYFDGIYIPAGLLVFGTVIVKREWAPYAVLIAIVLAAVKFWRIRMSPRFLKGQGKSLTIPRPLQNRQRFSSPTCSRSLSSRRRRSSHTMWQCKWPPIPSDHPTNLTAAQLPVQAPLRNIDPWIAHRTAHLHRRRPRATRRHH
jgi:hypothetical protein